jgi:hypothetical protein
LHYLSDFLWTLVTFTFKKTKRKLYIKIFFLHQEYLIKK